MKRIPRTLGKLVRDASPQVLSKARLEQLWRAYEDLERVMAALKKRRALLGEVSLRSIDVTKLLDQLARSKRRLERKIGNTLLLEKEHLQKKLHHLASGWNRRNEA